MPQSGGVIFCREPISNADPLAIGQFLAFSGRWPRYLAKASVFEIPVVGRIIAACGQIPVQRESAHLKDALIAASRAIEEGRALVIYPEGTITFRSEPWPMRGKTGAARLAFTTAESGGADRTVKCPELMPGRATLPQLFPRKTGGRCGRSDPT